MNIPQQLQQNDMRFVLIYPDDKKPKGESWNQKDSKNNYSYAEINDLLNKNPTYNYGFLCGYENYLVVDIDRHSEETYAILYEQAKFLPKTFTVLTRSGGAHLYYKIKDPENAKFLNLRCSGKEAGEIRWTNSKGSFTQVLGPGSQIKGNSYTVLYDIPITEVLFNQVIEPLKTFIETNQENIENMETDQVSELKITDFYDLKGLTRVGNEYYGEHPIHGSTSGKNFWVNTEKNTWFCFRDNVGGSAVQLYAILNGKCDCSELKNLKGKKYVELAKELETKFKKKILPEKEPDADEDFIINEEKVDFSVIRNALRETNKHLRLYDTIDKLLGLEGDKYYPVKKWMCYFYESFLQKAQQIQVGSAHYDNRVHSLIVASAGKGKGVIKNTIKHTLKNEVTDIIETSGLVHPEQLIGKMKDVGRGKDKHKQEAKGYLGYEILLHDETNSTINETAPNADQSMRIKRTAMDTYGFNQISKKLVDDFIKDALDYYPTVRCVDFMHPEQFHPCFFDKGTYRRYVCFELAGDKQLNVDDSTKSLFEETADYEAFKEYFAALKYSNGLIHFPFQMNEDCKKRAAKWIILWNNYVLNYPNSAVRRFGEMTFYSIKEYFFKYMAVLHLSQKKTVSDIPTTDLACIDTFHFLIETLENYCKYGDMANTSDVWRGAKDMEIKSLEYLYRKRAFSESQSTVRIEKFVEVLGELFGVQERQAKGVMSSLKARGYIGSKQMGKNGSKVWLSFVPALSNTLPYNLSIEQFWDEEIKGCKECSMHDSLGISALIIASYTRINPIINKKNNIYEEELTLFKQNKIELNLDTNNTIVPKDVNMSNYQVYEHPCTPCIPKAQKPIDSIENGTKSIYSIESITLPIENISKTTAPKNMQKSINDFGIPEKSEKHIDEVYSDRPRNCEVCGKPNATILQDNRYLCRSCASIENER